MSSTVGRPTQYTEDWLANEAKAFMEWMKKPRSIYFKTFAIERGYSPTRLHEFAQMSEEFSRVMSYAKEWQEQKLLTSALYNETNAAITKFALINHHKYRDKSQEEAQDIGIAVASFLKGCRDRAEPLVKDDD